MGADPSSLVLHLERPERSDKAASEELLRQADSTIFNMQRELERLRRAADLYRERRDGKHSPHRA